MDFSFILSVLASSIALIVFVYYNYDILRLKTATRPNPVTWLLWLFITTVNSITYLTMNWDWIKGLATFTDCLCVAFTTAVIFFRKELRGRLLWQNIWEKGAAAAGVISLISWAAFQSSTLGNQILQFAYAMAFLPMYLGLLEDPRREKAAVWFAFSFGFLLALIAAGLRWEGHWENLLSPGLYFVLHALAGVLASRQPRKKPSSP